MMNKIKAEMQENPNNKYIIHIGRFLLEHLERNPGDTDKLMADGKSIKDSLKAMREEARKSQVDGVGMLTEQEGYAVVLKYYGIEGEPTAAPPAPKPSFDVSLDDLL